MHMLWVANGRHCFEEILYLAGLDCNPKVLGQDPKMVNSRKWSGEGAKGLLRPGGEMRFAPAQNGVAPVQNRFRMVQKTLGRFLLPDPQRPFAPSPNHLWESIIFGPCPRTFGLQGWKLSPVVPQPGPDRQEITLKAGETVARMCAVLSRERGTRIACLGLSWKV